MKSSDEFEHLWTEQEASTLRLALALAKPCTREHSVTVKGRSNGGNTAGLNGFTSDLKSIGTQNQDHSPVTCPYLAMSFWLVVVLVISACAEYNKGEPLSTSANGTHPLSRASHPPDWYFYFSVMIGTFEASPDLTFMYCHLMHQRFKFHFNCPPKVTTMKRAPGRFRCWWER